MKFDWILLAEGVAQDARGALTLVGVSQNVFATPALPANTKRAVVCRLAELREGENYSLRLELTGPDGRAIAVQQGIFEVQGRLHESLPAGGLDLPVEIQFQMSDFGAHKFGIELTEQGTQNKLAQSIDFYVLNTTEIGPQP